MDEIKSPDQLEQDVEIITLTDENGQDEDFELLGVIEYQDSDYVILMPLSGDEKEIVVILKQIPIPGDEENVDLVDVEDDETLEKVYELFKTRYQDEFDFI